MRKAFSLLEIIFIIMILSIISIVAVPKILFNVNKVNIIKLRADVALIREGINKFRNKQILSNSNIILNNLDTSDTFLFNTIFKEPIISEVNTSGKWSKLSSNNYQAWIDANTMVNFTYNPNNFSFNCDFEEEYCKELTQ